MVIFQIIANKPAILIDHATLIENLGDRHYCLTKWIGANLLRFRDDENHSPREPVFIILILVCGFRIQGCSDSLSGFFSLCVPVVRAVGTQNGTKFQSTSVGRLDHFPIATVNAVPRVAFSGSHPLYNFSVNKPPPLFPGFKS